MRRRKSVKKKKRKHWPSHKYWTEYFMQNRDISLNGQATISKTFSVELLNRDGDGHTEEEINSFARYLEAGRDKALDMLRKAGIVIYVVGESRIECMSKDIKYKEEHLRRIARMLDQKKMATFKKSPGATNEQRKQWGLPGIKEIKQSSQRLLLGDSEFETHLETID